MTCRPLAACLALLVATALVASAGAQTLSADEKALASYKLTMPTVTKVAAVIRTLGDEATPDPKMLELAKIGADVEAIRKKGELSKADEARIAKFEERAQVLGKEIERTLEGGNPQTIAGMEAHVRAQPAAMKKLASEKLAPREFATCYLALFQATIVHGFLERGKIDMAKLPAGINPENIKFVQEHEKELAALQGDLQGGAGKKK
jgi:hypothetical protein